MSGTGTGAPPPAAIERLAGRPRTPALAAGLALITCVTVNVVDPNVDGALGWCPFKVATGGLDCPGCGVLRSTRALTRGDLLTAIDHNLLWVALLPALALAVVGWWRYERGSIPTRPRLAPPALAALGVVTAVFWVVRNLPSAEWLASGAM